jgi:DNA polymerase
VAVKLHCDFETRSCADLKVVGLDNYARDPSTDVWCMGYSFSDGGVQLWTPDAPDAPHSTMLAYVKKGGLVYAHNAAFELAIWNNICVPRYGWPPLQPSQMRCTMAMAYAMALPGSLEKAAAAVGIPEQKDLAGSRLMLQMAKPRTEDPLTWWDEPEKVDQLGRYCAQDVRVERELEKRLMPLSQDEQALWVLDQTINGRGVQIDTPSATAALKIVESEKQRLDKEMRDATGNFVSVCSEVKRIGDWLRLQGLELPGLAKADVLDALSLDALTPACRRVLLLRQEAGKTSTAKLKAMLEAASARDGRVRGTMQYHGAGTGRWAGRRIQPHNMPRPIFKHKEIEDAIDHFSSPEAADFLTVFYGSPLSVVSSSLRSLICAAPGRDLLAADFSNIEGRGLAWLAGDERKLKRFRDFDAGTGPDIYKVAAAAIMAKPLSSITDGERQIGKVAELACGYQGGVGAFQTMAKGYNVKVSDEAAERAKQGWRAAHPDIVNYWWRLEEAAVNAVSNPGCAYSAGPAARAVTFKVSGSFLWCRLPSRRVLCYPYPSLKEKETPWGGMKDQVHYMTVDGLSNKWVETNTYGGKLAENVTQAVCRDLLVAAIRSAEASGYPVVLHVHDEVVAEVPKDFGSLQEFEAICSVAPPWADGLPVVAKGYRGTRYRKG